MALTFSISTAVFASGIASAALALALWYLSAVPEAPTATRWWAGSFTFNALRHLIPLCGGILTPGMCEFLSQSANGIGTVLLIAGTLRYASLGGRQGWVLVALPITIGWCAAFTLLYPHFLLLTVPLFGASGLAMIATGGMMLRAGAPFRRSGHRVVAVTFILWGLHKLDYPFLRPIESLAPFGFMLAELFSTGLALGLIILVQRRQQHIAEQATAQALATEARLHVSEARYRDLIENSLLGVMVHDHGRPLYANAAYLRLFGFPAWEAFVAAGVFEVIHEDDRARLREYNRLRRAGGSAPEQYRYRGIRADGSIVWLENTVRVVDWNGQPAVQNMTSELSASERVQEELAASQRLLRTVIDSMPHLVSVRDRDARVLMVNRAWAEASGVSPEGYLHKDPVEMKLDPVETRHQFLEQCRDVVRTERPLEVQYPLVVLGKPRRYHTVRTPLRGENGEVIGVVSVSQDITQQREMEAQLRQAQKMEAVGQLTGGVAHDFNNLLGVILGNLELLERRFGADPESLRLVTRAARATERGAALTQRLLSFSRRQTLQPQRVNLGRHVTELLSLLQTSIGETVRIEAACDPVAGDVYLDPNQLENALINLAINARDAMPGGGVLRISVGPVDAAAVPESAESGGPDDPWSVLTVEDTGIGMEAPVLQRALEPFFTTKGPGSGSGLGLSMVYGFVEQSGGRLAIDSEVRHGTCVRMCFRRLEPGAGVETDGARPAADPMDGEEQTVLVVEDDPALRDMTVQVVRTLNYTALAAGDAHEALTALREHPEVGLLFTDVVLPGGMDGVVLAREARALRPALKVLFTSGYAETVFERHPSEVDGAELLRKPFRLKELAAKLREVMESPDPADPDGRPPVSPLSN